MIKKIVATLLLFTLWVQAFAVNPDDLLRPDVAFKANATALSPNRIKATWNIADKYYMYRERFSFKSDTPGITLGDAIIPKGKIKDDPGFGSVETYRNQVAIEIPVIRDASAAGATTLLLKTVSQGCADAGVCYPPQKVNLSLALDAQSAPVNKAENAPKKKQSLADQLGLSALMGNNAAPLPPEQAFKLKLNTEDGQLLKANWVVTKGHYLYQDKIKLRIIEPSTGLSLSDLNLPEGVDEVDPFFGEITTYNKDFFVTAKVDGNQQQLADAITLKVSYQGCSKLTGICYPPQHETLSVKFDQGQLIKVAATTLTSENDVASKPLSDSFSDTMSTPKSDPKSDPMTMLGKPDVTIGLGQMDPIPLASIANSSPMIEKSDLASQLGITSLETGLAPLDPDQAFVFDLSATNHDRLNARWDIVKGHYLYQHKFKFELLDAPAGITLGKAQLPKGKAEHDQYFGDIVTYYDSFDAKLAIIGNDNHVLDAVTVKTSYQGCSKLTGICYPPQFKTQTVSLASFNDAAVTNTSNNTDTSNTTAQNTNTENKSTQALTNNAVTDSGKALSVDGTLPVDGKVSEQDGFINKLTNGSFFNSLIIFFLAGLALTFTPCVFPMIPILSGIIAGQGSDNNTRKSFFLSLSYVLAMAVTYAVVGVIAALSGENLQVALQNPWVIGAFALLFVLLSLSMFGFYELQMPASIQSKLTNISNSQTGGSMMNAGIMGFLSALIVGPCVTAPLIAALVYIAQTKDVLLGGLSLFALGLGMGVPLLIIGTSAGKILPRAGAWMDNVKAGFGIMMLALGIWMLERILPFEIIVVLTGILVVFTGIYMGALDALNEASTGWKRFFKAAGLVVLIYGVTLLIGAASGNASLLKPLKGFGGGVSQVSAEPQHLVFKQVKGIAGINDALALAKQRNQTVMLDFYADWCISCKEMEHTTFTNKAVIDSLKNTLLIQADVTANDDLDKALLKQFGLFGPPAILFFDKSSQEKLPYRIVGYKGADDFHQHIQQFQGTLQ